MATADVDLAQVLALAAELEAKAARVGGGAVDVVRRQGQAVAADAIRRAPKRTGALAGSIRVVTSGSGLSGAEATVKTGVRYAAYVEYGTSDTAPQPFMVPAAQAQTGGFQKAMTELGTEGLT